MGSETNVVSLFLQHTHATQILNISEVKWSNILAKKNTIQNTIINRLNPYAFHGELKQCTTNKKTTMAKKIYAIKTWINYEWTLGVILLLWLIDNLFFIARFAHMKNVEVFLMAKLHQKHPTPVTQWRFSCWLSKLHQKHPDLQWQSGGFAVG